MVSDDEIIDACKTSYENKKCLYVRYKGRKDKFARYRYLEPYSIRYFFGEPFLFAYDIKKPEHVRAFAFFRFVSAKPSGVKSCEYDKFPFEI